MFRDYCVILWEFIVSTLLSYTSMSNAVVGNIIQFGIITDSCIWHTCVTWQGTDCELSKDDTVVSKHVAVWFVK